MINLLLNSYSQLSHTLPLTELKDKKIAIFGANGMIGRFFIGYLSYLNLTYSINLSITGFCRDTSKLNNYVKTILEDNNILLKSCDVTKPYTIESDCDYAVMAASPADPISYSKFPVETFLTNITSIVNLKNALPSETKTRTLFISSGEVYGANPNLSKTGYSETDYQSINHLDTRSCYSMGKKAAECLCHLYHEEYGVDTLIARLCHIYGPTITQTNSRADAQFLRKAAESQPIVMKSLGEQIRSYCYVGDLCTALLHMLVKGKSGEAYNVSNPDSVIMIREYAETLAKVANVDLTFEIPNSLEKKGYSKIQKAILNPEKLLSLGWKPAFEISKGLESTLRLYQAFNRAGV